MQFDWDPAKNASNQQKHGFGFEEARTLFTSGAEYFEAIDENHSSLDTRFRAMGPTSRGIIVVIWTEQPEGTIRIISARPATSREVRQFQRYIRKTR